MLQRAHAGWIEEALKAEDCGRDKIWSESLAVGSREFVARFQAELGVKGHHREILQYDDYYRLSEPAARYSSHFDAEMARLGAE